jgi:hypothetical protein
MALQPPFYSTVPQCGISCQMSRSLRIYHYFDTEQTRAISPKASTTMDLWRSPSRPSVISNSPCKQRGSRDFDCPRMGQTGYKHPLSGTLTSPMRLRPKKVKHGPSFWEAWVDKDIGPRDIPFDYLPYKRTPELRYPPHLISGWLGQADRLHGSPVLRLKILPVEQQESINTIFTELNFFRIIACSLPESCVQSKYSGQIQHRIVRGFHAASCDPRATPQSWGEASTCRARLEPPQLIPFFAFNFSRVQIATLKA